MQSRNSLIALVIVFSGCLGGEGKITPDAAPVIDADPNQPDADPNQPDADPDQPDAGDEPTACAPAMQGAPSVDQGLPYTDSLPTATINTWDKQTIPEADDPAYPGGKYRTLSPDQNGDIHPGCSADGLTYAPAQIPGYPCAAKEYPFPGGMTEDTTKPIVLLIHGNSDTPSSWEAYLHPNPDSITDFVADREPRPQLAERLPALGYRTIAVDLRIGLVDDPLDATGGNPARNIDHGWGVPIAQALIKQVLIANPGRRVSLVGFSLGATIVRDALRRLWIEWKDGAWDINVFSRVQDVVLASGGNHGVSTYGYPGYCGSNWSMKGLAACQFGQRNLYTQIDFHKPLNGPAVPEELTRAGEFGGWYEAPCANGDYAFGVRDACESSVVQYTTITMVDKEQGAQQDEFVSEHSSRLYPEACADNHLTTLNDFDTSAYFLNGLLRNHFGSIRSEAGLAKIIAALGN